MKVLITSGGTKIPIDTVRSITNMSHGTLGSRLAIEAIDDYRDEVFFLCAEGSKTPMSLNIDFMQLHPTVCQGEFEKIQSRALNYHRLYHEFRYKTFEDYQTLLPQIIALYKPDMIILAAAVSDYAPEKIVAGKIRTTGDLNIELKPLPKIISKVREWAGKNTILVGFKLLVDVEKEYLIEEARKSLEKNELDFVCANDLRTLLNGDHKISVVVKGQENINSATPGSLYSYLKGRITKQ